MFKVNPSGIETVLHSFTTGTDGSGPFDGMVPVGSNLYGTTASGGAFGFGTVFKLDKTGKETVLYSFTGGNDGAFPFAGLTADAAGNLYGTTHAGGAFVNFGTVFELDKAGKLTVLHSFTGGTDGSTPFGGVIRDSAGNLYGTTQLGGSSGFGTVFKITLES